MGKMAGFGEQYSTLYERRKERMDKAAERRQDWMDTYGVKGLNDMKDVAAVAFRNLNNLKGAGFTEKALEGLYLSGDIEALADMWKRIQKADPDPANLQSIIEQAEELATDGQVGDDLYSHIKRGLGLYKQGESSDQSKANVFASFLGYGPAKDPEGIEGYSYKDIRRISAGRTRREDLTGVAANIKIPKRIDYDATDASKTETIFERQVFPRINTLAKNFKAMVEGGTFISDLDSGQRTEVSNDRIEIGKLIKKDNEQYTLKDRISGINKILIKPVYGGMDSGNQLLNEFFEFIEDSVKINPQLQNIPNPADYFTFLPRDTRSAFNAWYATRQSR